MEPCKNCLKFINWFVRSWSYINQFAWSAVDIQGKLDHFKYELPHEQPVMDKDPCLDCICKEWCDTPCRKRLKWWDIQMAGLRQALGYRGCDSE